MRTFAVRFCLALTLLGGAAVAHAAQYPPGPGGTCTDSVTIARIQDIGAVCHPAAGDTVYGVRGIVIGIDALPTAYAFWIENSQAGPFSGIQVFTGSTNYNGPVPGTPSGGNVQPGDSVVVYGASREFNNRSEVDGFDTIQGTNDIIVRRISPFNALPPFNIATTTQVNWVPTAPGSQGEALEGTLVKIRGPLRVGRSIGPGIGTRSFLVATDPPTADSAAVDGFSLTNVIAPAVGTVVDSVQGIVDDVTISGIRSYRILLRNSGDLFAQVPPNLTDAYPVEDNKIRVLFDREVTAASAQDVNNYSLGSFGTVDAAQFESGGINGSAVILTVTNGLSDGDGESVTVSGIVASGSGLAMTSPQNRTFINGVLSIDALQAPDPIQLGGAPCRDRSRFTSASGGSGQRLSYRGVAVHAFGALYYVMDPIAKGSSGLRSGMAVFGPTQPLLDGHRYLIAGQVQEFDGTVLPAAETEGVSSVYIKDEGLDPAIDVINKPQIIADICAVRDTTCDAAQGILTGEDYEGALVRIRYARVVEQRVEGASFRIAGGPANACTLLVVNSGTNSYTTTPDSAHTVSITGIIAVGTGRFQIQPRNQADITDHGLNVGVGPLDRTMVSFSASPNPAHRPVFSFSIPQQADVELAVYDLAGRKLAVVAKGRYDAGSYTREWDGRNIAGSKTAAGMYFYRLRVGNETFKTTGVRLN